MPVDASRPPLQKLVRRVFFGLIGLAIIGYTIFQARFLLAGPQLALTAPLDTVQNSRSVTIVGQAHNINHITLNDRQIFTNEYGEFNEDLILENGYTIATLAATDRYGRETKVSLPFVYQPAPPVTINTK